MKNNSQLIHKYRAIILTVVDAVIVFVAYFAAYFFRMDFGASLNTDYSAMIFRCMPIVLLLNLVFLLLFHVNKTLWQYVSIDEIVRIAEAICLANGIWFLVVCLLPVKNYPRSIPVTATMIQLIMMLALRVFYRMYRRHGLQANSTHRALIIGAGSAGGMAIKELSINERYDSKVVGLLDDNPDKKGQILSGCVVLGTTDDLKEVAAKNNVDLIYIAITNISKQNLKVIIDKCRDADLKCKIISSVSTEGDKAVTQIRDVSIDDLLGRGEIKMDNQGIQQYLSGKTIMVTGAGGSIGSEIVRQIVRFHPRRLVLLDIYENNMYDLQQELLMGKRHDETFEDIDLVCLIASIRDKKRIDDILEEYHPSVVFHAAAHKHVPLMEDSPLESIKNNVFGTYNVINSCIEHHVEKFVAISTDKAVNPTNVMGASKRMCELIIQGFRDNGVTKLCAVRFGNVLGSSGSVIPLFKREIEEGGPVTVTDPNIIRYFMTIPEAAQLVLQAGTYAKNGEIFILDMGKPVKILSLAENLIRLSGFEPYKDIDIKITGLRPGEKMYEELQQTNEEQFKTDNELIFVAEPMNITKDGLEEKLDVLRTEVQKDDCQHIKDVLFELIRLPE